MAGRYQLNSNLQGGYSPQAANPYAQYGMPYGDPGMSYSPRALTPAQQAQADQINQWVQATNSQGNMGISNVMSLGGNGAGLPYGGGYAGPLGGVDPYVPSSYSPNFNFPNVYSPFGENPYTGSDIAQQYVNNRNMQLAQGSQFQGYFGAAGNQFANAMDVSGQNAANAYAQLAQNPGYTSAEANAMLGNGPNGNYYSNLNNIDYGSNFLSPDQQAAMMGNPYAPGQAFDPSILNNSINTAYNGGMGYRQETQDQLGQAYGTMADAYGNALNPNDLRMSNQYSNNLSNVLTQTGNTVMNAANRSDLGMNGGYASGMMSAANNPNLGMNGQYASGMMGAANNSALQMNQQYASNLKGFAADPRLQMNQGYAQEMQNAYSNPNLAMNQDYANKTETAFSNPNLGITSEYGRQAGMTDAEVAQAAAMGGQAVGAQTRASIQDLQAQAAAQGNSSPLAVAAMRNAMLDTGAVNTADAAVQAQLAARAQQRQAATGVEQTRLGAEQFQTGAELAGLQNIENTRLGAQQFKTGAEMQGLQNIEGTRLGAQQFQTGAQMGAEQNIENTRLGAQQYQTGAQLGAMQNVENTRLGANQFMTQAQLQALQNVENTRLGANQFQAGAQMQGGTAMGQMALGALNQQEAMRLGANQYYSGAQMGAASNLGNYAQQNYMYGGNQAQNLQNMYLNASQNAGMYNQSNQYNAWANAEQQASQRAGGIALNQQGVNQANQANQFNRGFQTQGQLSALQQQIANQRIAGQTNLQNYYTGQQGFYGGMYNQANANLLTNRAQTQQGANQATQGSAQWELGNRQFPTIGSSIVRGLAGGAISGLAGAVGGG